MIALRYLVWIDPDARCVIGLRPSLPGEIDPALARAPAAPGCYVRGSRTIVLRRAPEGGGGPALVRERAEALKRLAGYSQSFWLERVR